MSRSAGAVGCGMGGFDGSSVGCRMGCTSNGAYDGAYDGRADGLYVDGAYDGAALVGNALGVGAPVVGVGDGRDVGDSNELGLRVYRRLYVGAGVWRMGELPSLGGADEAGAFD